MGAGGRRIAKADDNGAGQCRILVPVGQSPYPTLGMVLATDIACEPQCRETSPGPWPGVCNPGEVRSSTSRLSAGGGGRSQAPGNPFGHGLDPAPTQEV